MDAPAPGTTLGHYRIISKLGAGGMGEVWRARDTRLNRDVAIKVLPAKLTSDNDRVRRFELEAQTASALNHPNIITIHDIGDSEAGRFIVMELVEGRPLRDLIAEGCGLDTIAKLGRQIARALSAAHAAGITHRDIKPENIMVREDGYVKVLDFGLARLLPDASSGEEAVTLARQTMPGQLLGTIAYMSPEQASGQSVGHPSDIFALGIVLYELATRRHPFRAGTLVGHLHAITTQTPAPPSKESPNIPAALEALILRMLQKDPGARPGAGEVAQALDEWERWDEGISPTAVEGETLLLQLADSDAARANEGFRVAVLPFKWRGGDADLETLAEGLAEEIVTGLSRFSYLRVIARSSTQRYAVNSSDVRLIGRELGARYVMEGSLRQAGSMLRLAVQLVDASTGAHLWAQTYDRTFSSESVFEVQDDLVPRIVSTVADWYGVLPHSMSEAVRFKPTDELTPYEAVLRSFGYYERISPEEHAAVRAGLEQAVERAPRSADGWAMLSMIYGEEHRFSFNVQPDPLGRSLQAAQRAIDTGPTNHFAWLALAQALFFRKELYAFRDAADRAIALNPMDGSTIEYMSHLIAFSGEWERGTDLAERARQLNPNHPGWYWAVPYLNAYRKGDYKTARTFMLKANQPGHFFTQALLAALYGQLGEREAGERAVRKVFDLKPDYALTGRQEFEKWYLPELVEQLMEGLGKAGLEVVAAERAASAPPAADPSGGGASPTGPISEQSTPNRTIDESSKTQPTLTAPATTDSLSASRPSIKGRRHTVGRERECRELEAAFAEAQSGRGSLLCIAGEPGIGKTTLVEDFLSELAATERCTIARGRCSERLAGTEAYLPLLEALESLSRSDKGIAQTMKELSPTWYAQVAPLTGDSEESARLLSEIKTASQERMKRELVSFVRAVGEQRSLVLFFDDLQWADVSTIDLLSYLAGRIDALHLLIVTTYRSSDMQVSKHPFLSIRPDLQARGVCRELVLEFLTEKEIGEYLQLEFPQHRFPAELSRLIHERTEGSPLFVSDLARYLRDRGVIAWNAGTDEAGEPAWELAKGLPDLERELPESVRAMIERKLAQLSEEDRRMLIVASVQGYEFDSAVLAEVLNLESDEVEQRLEKLDTVFAFVKLAAEGEFPNHTLRLRYRFVHLLYQNALYASLRITRRASLSAAVANSLERLHGSQSAGVANEIALLWQAAREYSRAADWFLSAARHASQAFAHHEAAASIRRGLAMLENLPQGPDRMRRELEFQLMLGPAVMVTQGWSASELEAVYSKARENCLTLGDKAQLFPVLSGLWNFYLVRADYKSARKLGEELLALAEIAQEPPPLVVAHWALVESSFWTADYEFTSHHINEVVNLYDLRRDRSLALEYGQDPWVICCAYDALVLLLLGYPDRSLKRINEVRTRANQLEYPFDIGMSLLWSAKIRLIRREPVQALELADALATLSQEQGFAFSLHIATAFRGWALAELGKLDEGIAEMERGVASLRDTGTAVFGAFLEALLAEQFGRAKRIDEGMKLIDQAIEFAETKEERFYEPELHRLKGELLRVGGAPTSEVSLCFEEATEIARRQRASFLELRAVMSLARLWQQEGKRAEARKTLAQIYGTFAEGFDTLDLSDARDMLARLGP